MESSHSYVVIHEEKKAQKRKILGMKNTPLFLELIIDH